jgi:putative nucleotide binding protein
LSSRLHDEKTRFFEEYAYVLDYLPRGNPLDRHPQHRRSPVAQVLGDRFFILLEIQPRKRLESLLEPGSRIYLGEEARRELFHVHGRICYDDLTMVAKGNLPPIVRRIVEEREKLFVMFFNLAKPITLRLHSLELLPGIGKRTLKIILEERRRKPFESFQDIHERTRIPDPAGMLAERILSEIRGEEKYYLFVPPPRRQRSSIYVGYLELLYKEAERQGQETL